MEKISIAFVSVLLLAVQLTHAQKEQGKKFYSIQNKRIYWEAGINLSLPAHDDLLRTHTLAIGINVRASRSISSKINIGLKAEYSYRFAKEIRSGLKNDPDITDETIIRASHRNFSLICLKPNVQFNLRSHCFFGVETGIGYAISEGNSTIGFGFVEEYNGKAQLGSCSGLYLGKYFVIGTNKKGLGLSLNWSNFLIKSHAENFAGIGLKYCFNK
jgi:hypothetical protein